MIEHMAEKDPKKPYMAVALLPKVRLRALGSKTLKPPSQKLKSQIQSAYVTSH
jgi:hypothetical protein